MHKNIDGILNILEFVDIMSADMRSADILWASNNWFTDLKTYTETIRKTVVHIIRILVFKMKVRVSCVIFCMPACFLTFWRRNYFFNFSTLCI